MELSDFNYPSIDTHAVMPADELTVSGLGIGGTFFAECFKADGTLRWKDKAKNIIPNVVLNDILNVYFAQSSNTSAFSIGLVDNNGFSAFAATDTMASHTGWSENQQISNGSRPTWSPGAAASQAISNPTAAVFNMTPTSGCTIKGFFLTSNNTLGGTSGNLVATAALTAPQACNNGDTLKCTYAINGTTT